MTDVSPSVDQALRDGPCNEPCSHGDRVMAQLGWEEGDDGLGLNGVLPGGGRCAACHALDIGEGYLLCQPCWDRLPAEFALDLTDLWDQLNRADGTAGTIGEIRDRQAAALRSIEHVPANYCPYCSINPHDGFEVFARVRPDLAVQP